MQSSKDITVIEFARNGEKSEINIAVKMNDVPSDVSKQLNRLKFVASRKLSQYAVTSESKISMQVSESNKSNSFQSPYTSESTLTVGSQLVYTIPGDKACFKDCVYLIKIQSQNISGVVFSVEFPTYETTRKLDSFFSVHDQVLKDYPLTFSLDQNEVQNMEFYLIPLEGDPDLFINPAKKTKKLEDSRWSSKQIQKEERLVITKKQCQDARQDCKRMVVTVSSKVDHSSFLLVVSQVTSSTPFYLDMNIPYSGVVKKDEIINFNVVLNARVCETLRASVELVANYGNPDLYVLDCEFEEQCFITKDMIKNRKDLKRDPNK